MGWNGSKPTIAPATWRPPPAPALSGPYAPNRHLDGVERWAVPGTGPEDVAVAPDGTVYTGLADGRVLALRPGRTPREVAATHGRPLGVEVDVDGTLVVCDAVRGLLRVDPTTGAVDVLVAEVAGRPLRFVNNATITPDGRVWFTESSSRLGLAHWRGAILEHRPSGAVLGFDPETRSVEVVADGLVFANGVTVAPGGEALLVAETARYRILRVPLSGPQQGRATTFVDNLPGSPDNLSTGPDGTVWAAIPSTRVPALDRLLPLPGVLRKLVWALPERLTPAPVPIAFVLGFDDGGAMTHNLQGDPSRFRFVTGVREHDGWLYLGSLVEDAVGRVRLP